MKKPGDKSVVRHVRLPVSLDKKLQKLAQKENRSLGTFLRLVILQRLERER